MTKYDTDEQAGGYEPESTQQLRAFEAGFTEALAIIENQKADIEDHIYASESESKRAEEYRKSRNSAVKKNAELNAIIEKQREALSFYADSGKYKRINNDTKA